MTISHKMSDKLLLGFRIVFIMIWLSNLAATDAYFIVYTLVAFGSFFCTLDLYRRDYRIHGKQSLLFWILGLTFSILVLLANYGIFTQILDPERIQASTNLMVNLINTVLSFAGGTVVFRTLFIWLWSFLSERKFTQRRVAHDRRHLYFTLGSFLFIVLVNLIHLFLVEYPGNVTEDPFTQISEMVAGSYSNFNTFWHTMFMQGILSVGYLVFGDVNAAVAVYCVVQMLILASAFAYCLDTLYLSGIHTVYLLLTVALYALIPYNMALSITIWKDVLFAAGSLLMISAIFRILKDLGTKQIIDYVALILGAILFALARNNGWYILLVSVLVFAILLRKHRKLLVCLGAAFVFCWVLTNPVLDLLNVDEGEYSEAFSVPLQQVSRVIVDGCELTEQETALISRVLDIEEVPDLYVSWLSDPIKLEFRSNDTAYFEEHLGEYVKLWLQLGMKYPAEYLKAWVDQTKGYWNGGYNYALYSETVTDNPYGVEKSGGNNIVAKLFRLYFGLSRHIIFFEPLHSIGLHVWALLLCFIFQRMCRREEAAMAVPFLLIILGLCLGTPVYCSFRYAYPVFTAMPLILGTTVFPVSNVNE